MTRSRKPTLALLAALTLASPLLVTPALPATFQPAAGNEPVSLVAGDPATGTIAVGSSGVVERVVGGRPDRVLSISMDIHNRGDHGLVVKPLDVWVVTGTGTVLSLPELRLDGLSVGAAEIPPGRKGRLVALFQLGPVEAFDRFEVHWAGRLGTGTVTGEAAFVSEDGGYEPPAGGEIAGGGQGDAAGAGPIPGEGGFYDAVYVDPYPCDDYLWYGCYGYPYGYYYFGLGYYGYYGYYGHHHHGGLVVGGRSDRQVKEDVILRRTGQAPRGDVSLPRGREGTRAPSAAPAPTRSGRSAGVTPRGSPPRSYGGMRSGTGRSGGSMRSGGGRSGGGRSSGGSRGGRR